FGDRRDGERDGRVSTRRGSRVSVDAETSRRERASLFARRAHGARQPRRGAPPRFKGRRTQGLGNLPGELGPSGAWRAVRLGGDRVRRRRPRTDAARVTGGVRFTGTDVRAHLGAWMAELLRHFSMDCEAAGGEVSGTSEKCR